MKDIKAIMRGKQSRPFYHLTVSQNGCFYRRFICVCLLSLVMNGAKCFNRQNVTFLTNKWAARTETNQVAFPVLDTGDRILLRALIGSFRTLFCIHCRYNSALGSGKVIHFVFFYRVLW